MTLDDRTRRSRIYQEAVRIAADYVQNPEKLKTLLSKAEAKAGKRNGALNDAWQQLQTLNRMLRSYYSGEYTQISNKTLVLMVAAVLYFLMPADLIPDILLGLGYLDDAAIIAWTMGTISEELERYQQWHRIENSAMGKQRAAAREQREGLLIEGELD